jgi:putative FmdB family regulatory protein
MPKYDFICKKCGKKETVRQSIKEDVEAPVCEKDGCEMKRDWSSGMQGLIFRGEGGNTGFYSKDYD